MDLDNCHIACDLVSSTYINQGSQALVQRRKLVKTLLSQRRLPHLGWDEATVELFLQETALMDSNNFLNNVGVGEREGRVASNLVSRRHFRLAHGIGRSGEVAAQQPKAAGSSLLARLSNELAADALRLAGMADLGPVLTLPLATGMALTSTLLAVRGMRPPTARYVVWTRIDQKTCLKCILAAGYEPVVVPMRQDGDQLVTDLEALRRTIETYGADAVACVLTTTSCFAPRAADDVVGVAKLCARLELPHVINNAYGVQSAELCALVTSAWRKGRVDAVVQSTDKNFMVPVGGAIVVAPRNRPDLVNRINALYPGRAAMAPLLDLLITLLQWGVSGWKQRLADRDLLRTKMESALRETAQTLGERVLEIPGNPISMAMTLDTLQSTLPRGSDEVGEHPADNKNKEKNPASTTFLGSMLFARGASGARVIVPGKSQTVGGIRFEGYGASCDDYRHAYLTVAAAIGGSETEAVDFFRRLEACVSEFRHRNRNVLADDDVQKSP